jgi:hypothetical protein
VEFLWVVLIVVSTYYSGITKHDIFVNSSMPDLYIIAGCNGAGKTTASFTILPEMLNCKEFVNADNIAAGLSPFNPESVAMEAGRLMLLRIHELMRSGVDFAFETTLPTGVMFPWLWLLKRLVILLHFFLFGWTHPKQPSNESLTAWLRVGIIFLWR